MDALKWSGIKEYLDSPLSADRIEQKSGCAVHHNDNHNSLLILEVTDVIQICHVTGKTGSTGGLVKLKYAKKILMFPVEIVK